jgi:hypothetical protein
MNVLAPARWGYLMSEMALRHKVMLNAIFSLLILLNWNRVDPANPAQISRNMNSTRLDPAIHPANKMDPRVKSAGDA